MRSLRLLLYPQRVNLLRLNERKYTRDTREKRRLTWMLLAYAMAVLVLPMYGFFLAQGLYEAGAADAMVMYACALSAVLALVFSVVSGYNALFGRRDTDFVGALPFSQQAVALSRLIPMYLSALLSAALLMAPAIVFHLVVFGVTPGTVAVLVALVLLTPMLPTALGVLFSAAIAWISARFRHKNVLISVLGVLATGALVLSAQLLPMQATDMEGVRTLVEAVRQPLQAMYPPSAWADAALKPGGGVQLLWFALVNALPLGVAALALGRYYFALHDRVTIASRSKAGACSTAAPGTALRALVVKELRGLVGRPMYLMNSCVGMWLAPIMLFGLPLFLPDAQAMLAQEPGLLLLIKRLSPVLLSVFLSMMSTTAVAVSLEGTAAWLMYTCPVASETIYKSKLYAHLVLALPAVTLSVIAGMLIVPLTAMEALAAWLFPAAVSLWMGVAGLRWDVRFRRFAFKNETEMVKQSVQVLLTMLTGTATLLVLGGLIYLSGYYATWVALGGAAALAMLSIVLFRPLKNKPLYLVD